MTIITYPAGFNLSLIGDIIVPTTLNPDLAPGMEWGVGEVIVDSDDDDFLLDLKEEIHRVASEVFDYPEEEKVMRKRADLKNWLITTPEGSDVIDFMKLSPADQYAEVIATPGLVGLRVIVAYLAVFVSALIEELYEE